MKTVRILLSLFMGIIPIVSLAQIGYQVSLLNSATGEPRAGETVEVGITLTDNEENIIYEETQTETTNDFGILSLTIGNSTTFDDVDWSKLPFFISVSVDGKLVGKSQVLTVPVAEYAKRTGVLTKELLVGTWHRFRGDEGSTYTFNIDGTGSVKAIEGDIVDYYEFNYYIDGNLIDIIYTSGEFKGDVSRYHYIPQIQKIGTSSGALSK